MFIEEYIKCFKKAIPLGLVIGQVLIFIRLAEVHTIDIRTAFLYDFIPIISLGYLYGCQYIYAMEQWGIKKKTFIQTILLVPLYFIYLKIGIGEWYVILIGNGIWIILVLIKDYIRFRQDKADAEELNKLLENWNDE